MRNVFSKYEDLATKLTNGSFATVLAVDELWYSPIADYVKSIAAYQPLKFEVISKDVVPYEVIKLPDDRHLLNSLNFYFTTQGTHKEYVYHTATRELQSLYLDFLRKFSNSRLPTDQIEDDSESIDHRRIYEFFEMDSYVRRLDKLIGKTLSAEVDANVEISEIEQHRDELATQAAIARKELVETLAATVQERTRNELALSALDEQARSLHIHLSQAIKEADGFIAKCSELIHEIVLYQDTPYIEGLNKRQKKKAFDAQGKRIKAGKSFISENEVKLLEIAAAIRSRPDEALSLYNATIYFVATKLLRTTNNEDRLLKVSARQIKDAVCLSYANAGKDERNWFKGLESIASDDTAKDLYALLIEGVSDPYEDRKMTFSDLSTFLEQIIDNDARLSAVSTRAETMYAFANGIVDTPTLDAVAMVANRDVVDAEVVEDSFDPQPSGPTL